MKEHERDRSAARSSGAVGQAAEAQSMLGATGLSAAQMRRRLDRRRGSASARAAATTSNAASLTAEVTQLERANVSKWIMDGALTAGDALVQFVMTEERRKVPVRPELVDKLGDMTLDKLGELVSEKLEALAGWMGAADSAGAVFKKAQGVIATEIAQDRAEREQSTLENVVKRLVANLRRNFETVAQWSGMADDEAIASFVETGALLRPMFERQSLADLASDLFHEALRNSGALTVSETMDDARGQSDRHHELAATGGQLFEDSK